MSHSDSNPSKSTSTADYRTLMSNISEADILETINLFAYQGFVPKFVESIIMTKESKTAVFVKELEHLLLVFLCRGSNINKILEKSRGAVKAKLTKLVHKYEIVSTGTPLKITSVTLPRLAACFPKTVVKLIEKFHKRIKFPSKCPSEIPYTMRCSVAASVIPSRQGSITTALLEAHFSYLKSFDEVINPGRKTDEDTIKKYQRAAHASPMLPEEDRLSLAKDLKWIMSDSDGNITINEDLASYLAEVKKRLKRSRDSRKTSKRQRTETSRIPSPRND